MAQEILLAYHSDFRRRGERWAIINCRRPGNQEAVRVKINAEPGSFERDAEYRFYGTWHENSHGKTFFAKSFAKQLPSCRDGVVRLLMSAPSIGPQTAERLWAQFGNDAIETVINRPAQAALGVPRWSVDKAIRAGESLSEVRGEIGARIELTELLGGRGFPRTLADDVLKKYGNRGPELIRRNPFLLSQFGGAGFKRCDDLWIDMGLSPLRIKRQTLALIYGLSSDSRGDTWHTHTRCARLLHETISGSAPNMEKAIELGVRAKLLSTRELAGEPRISLRQHDIDEQTIAECAIEAAGELCTWPAVDDMSLEDLTDHQRSALQDSLASNICLLVGSPGTGKTFTAGRLLREIVKAHGAASVALCAPTGKAAHRLSEMAKTAGVYTDARTVHGLLEVLSVSGGQWFFRHDHSNPLPYDFILVDESSMLDAHIAACLLSAKATGTKIMFIGDVGQLPSVGPGAVLSDLIDAGAACGELTEIQRNAGSIVRACRAIRLGEPFDTDRRISPDEGVNLRHIPASGAQAAIRRVTELAIKLRDRRMCGDSDFQVLCATNKTRQILNEQLRHVFNTQATGKYDCGDRVICLANGMRPAVNGGDQRVLNGEIGTVVKAHDNRTEVVFQDPHRHVLFFEKDAIDQAWCITAHKSQGSEWPIVAVVIEDTYGARMVTDCGWLLTAISRAKTACFLVGSRRAADGMCERRLKRTTGLAERITEYKQCVV